MISQVAFSSYAVYFFPVPSTLFFTDLAYTRSSPLMNVSTKTDSIGNTWEQEGARGRNVEGFKEMFSSAQHGVYCLFTSTECYQISNATSSFLTYRIFSGVTLRYYMITIWDSHFNPQ